jgi:hypothetical protein
MVVGVHIDKSCITVVGPSGLVNGNKSIKMWFLLTKLVEFQSQFQMFQYVMDVLK